MARHPDRYVPPLPVQNVKAVVFHLRFLLNQLVELALLPAASFRHCSHSTREKDQEQALHGWVGGEVLFGDLVFLLDSLAVDHGDAVAFGEGMQAAEEGRCHAHQTIIIQLLVRAYHSRRRQVRNPTAE